MKKLFPDSGKDLEDSAVVDLKKSSLVLRLPQTIFIDQHKYLL